MSEHRTDSRVIAELTAGPEMIARAFAIADQAMLELLQSECVPIDGEGVRLGLCDEACGEVGTLTEASAAIREAVDWLNARGYVEIGRSEHGEHIVVRGQPEVVRPSDASFRQ